MLWIPQSFRDGVWLLWKLLTDPAPKPIHILGPVKITCPHCGRSY